MEIKMVREIHTALNKYGVVENLCDSDDLNGQWKRYIAVDSFTTDISTLSSLKYKLINQGRILEERIENQSICWLFQIKGFAAPEALLLTVLDVPRLYIGAFAKEGLFSKGTAQKTINQVKELLQS